MTINTRMDLVPVSKISKLTCNSPAKYSAAVCVLLILYTLNNLAYALSISLLILGKIERSN